MKKIDTRKVITIMLKHVNHQGVFGMGINTRQIAELLGVTYTTASKTLKSLEAEGKVIFIKAGKYSHWVVNHSKFEEIDGDTEFMLSTQNQTEFETYKLTDFQLASMLSMANNCIRPTTYPDTVYDEEEQDYADNGYTIFYPEYK